MRKLLMVMGVPIDDVDMPSALSKIEEFICEGRSRGVTHQIVTVNADFVINAQRDPELRQILQEADMATADGMPLVWSARLLGVPLAGRVTGADLVPALAMLAADRGYTIYLLGGGPGVAARAAEVLHGQFPALRIVGAVSPAYRSVLDAEPVLVEDIRSARPDVLLVAFGNPKQEKWIAMHAPELAVPVMMGIGGTLDFIAGITRRAPEWMQRSGLEWVYRLAQEPRRLWRRYVMDLGGLAYFFLREWWALRRPVGRPALVPTSGAILVEDVAILTVEGPLTLVTRDSVLQQAEELLEHTSHLIVDLGRADFLDSSGYGALVTLAKRAQVAGGELCLAEVQPRVAQVLKVLRLDQFFVTYPDVSTALAARQPQPLAHVDQPGPVDEPAAISTRLQTIGPHGWQTLKAPRRLDAMTASEFRQKCSALLAVNARLIVDLSATTFLASAGLAALIALTREAAELNGELRLACLTPDALRVVKIAKLESVLTIYADAAFAGS